MNEQYKKNIQNTFTGHYFNKHASKNIIYRFLVYQYKVSLQKTVNNIYPKPSIALEIGSGEGSIISYTKDTLPNTILFGSDIDQRIIKLSSLNLPYANWFVCEGSLIPFKSNIFDLVIVCEVFEHVYNPDVVLIEIARVTNSWMYATIPNEPWWRVLNMIRLKYINSWGNTPGHVNHWDFRGFKNFIEQHFIIQEINNVFPWITVLAKRKFN